MDFKNIHKKYRPVPFWSWNEKLETDETKEQIRRMNDAGLGGFFMHARGGLQTAYMGEEWFENVDASIAEANSLGMNAWAYDENGWPSGFGNGAVNGLGVEYCQKYLRIEESPEHEETAICKCGNHYFYYEVNSFYVDTLDEKVIKEFIKVSYEPYYERYKNEIKGFFTDEPQISRNGIPWSFVFQDEYKARFDENILEHLEELYFPIGDYKRTRVNFWKMVTDLFSKAYMKQIYDWCDERGLMLTGHLVSEFGFITQLTTNGACMPHYEYFHIPGMDWLGREVKDGLEGQQLGSVAEQLGKKQVMSETFAMCGHNVSFDELKGIYEWQMIHGVNLLCQHLEGYSNRGIRKRDYPPAMYIQQPWWDEYRAFNDGMSREGMVLGTGEKQVSVLVLHPQTTAWTMFDANENKGIQELNESFYDILKKLEAKHIEYHLGDETIMERHGRVENGKLIIGTQSYTYVIDPGCEVLFENTKRLLSEFEKGGGRIVSESELPENPVVDNGRITYKKSIHKDFTAHFFANTTPELQRGVFTVEGKVLDIYSGELLPFGGEHTFEPWGSLMIIEDGSKNQQSAICSETVLPLEGKFKVSGPVMNSLTLDHCDYWFDGELQEEQGYVLNVCERANALERSVKIHQEYKVNFEYVPEKLWLVCETPEIFDIAVNGSSIKKEDCGYFRDKSFKKLDISAYARKGENIIAFDCDFCQSPEFYENMRKSKIFESEKNKLSYDMEIEAIYLLGDFSVKTDGEFTEGNKGSMRYRGGFTVSAPVKDVTLKNLEAQGFPFFCGSLVLEGEIDIKGENPVLITQRKGVNALTVEINGLKKTYLTGNRIPLAEFGAEGKTAIRLTLTNNLRNLLGPHHINEGETYYAAPGSFYKEQCVWSANPELKWDDDYYFMPFGI